MLDEREISSLCSDFPTPGEMRFEKRVAVLQGLSGLAYMWAKKGEDSGERKLDGTWGVDLDCVEDDVESLEEGG